MLSKEQTEKLQKEENLGFEMQNLKSHVAYKHLIELANDRLEYFDVKIHNSIDPNEVFACTKEKNGILFFIRECNELIEQGIKARNRLLSNTP